MYSALPSQVVNQKKEVQKTNEKIAEDYNKTTNVGNALNINRYYLVLIGRALELFGTIRLYEAPNSMHYYEQQIKYLEYAFDTMSAKITEKEYHMLNSQFEHISDIKDNCVILNAEGTAARIKLKEARDLSQSIRKLYRSILAILEAHDMLTFKDLNPNEVLSDYGE